MSMKDYLEQFAKLPPTTQLALLILAALLVILAMALPGAWASVLTSITGLLIAIHNINNNSKGKKDQ